MKQVIIFLLAFIAIITSAGCLNYAYETGRGFYTVIGLLNIAGTIFVAYKAIKMTKDEK